jgi:hypothetical protein
MKDPELNWTTMINLQYSAGPFCAERDRRSAQHCFSQKWLGTKSAFRTVARHTVKDPTPNWTTTTN